MTDDRAHEMYLAETADERARLAEQAQQATDRAAALLAPLEAKVRAQEARERADHRAAVLREADDAPLSPFYEHPACGFHWHGRDGMDIPMRDGQPVCPRCELRRLAAEAQPSQPAAATLPGVYEQLADRLDVEHARRFKAAWSPDERTAAREWSHVAAFVRGLAREQQPAEEAGRG